VSRFVVCSSHTGRQPPWCCIIDAPSEKEIKQQYPLFADQPIYRLPEERPDWLGDGMLSFLEAPHRTFRLGEQEPKSLSTLLGHLANGEVWEWYELEERPREGGPVTDGELGTFRRFEVESNVGGLPRKPGRWHVAAIEAAPHPGVAAKLVIEPTIQDGEPQAS
jgi:hypothetical protein